MSEDVKTEDARIEDLGGVDWVARAKALTPLIEAAADEIEKQRRVTDEVMAALHDAQMFRMMMPRSIGGGEALPAQYTQAGVLRCSAVINNSPWRVTWMDEVLGGPSTNFT